MIGELSDVAFFGQLWARLVGDEFTVDKLVRRVRVDGGVDIENLRESDLRDLVDERYSGNWQEVAFSASEMLASYSGAGGIAVPEQVVGWVFAAVVLSDAVAADAADWDRSFDILLNGFFTIRAELTAEEALSIFTRILGCRHA